MNTLVFGAGAVLLAIWLFEALLILCSYKLFSRS